MAFYEVGQDIVRKIAYDDAVKQIVVKAYKFKQLVSDVTTSAWKNYFFREQTDIPGDQPGNAIKGIPRGADFPNAVVTWERVASMIEKYGLSGKIDMEDIKAGEVDVRNRTLKRIAEGVAKAVDYEISIKLSENWTPSSIQTGALKAGFWDETSAAIIKDLAFMKAQVKAYYDQASDFAIVINPLAEPHVLHYVYEKGAQASTSGQAAFNGEIGNPAGVRIITSDVVPTSYALFVVPQTCGTWKSLMALETNITTDKFKGDTIEACEIGVCELHEPKQVVMTKILAG